MMAAADVNATATGPDMKSIRKPDEESWIKKC